MRAIVWRVLQPHVLERLPAVGRLVDAVAERRALAVVRFARADPDDVRVLLADGQVADRRRRVGLEDRRPRRAVVDGLEDAARGEAEVDDRRVALDDGDVVDAAADVGGADRPEAEVLQQRIVGPVDGRRLGRRRRRRLRERAKAERRDDREEERRETRVEASWFHEITFLKERKKRRVTDEDQILLLPGSAGRLRARRIRPQTFLGGSAEKGAPARSPSLKWSLRCLFSSPGCRPLARGVFSWPSASPSPPRRAAAARRSRRRRR